MLIFSGNLRTLPPELSLCDPCRRIVHPPLVIPSSTASCFGQGAGHFLSGVECGAGVGVAGAAGVAVAAVGLAAFLCFFMGFLAAGALDIEVAGAD